MQIQEAWTNHATYLMYLDHFEFLDPAKDLGFEPATMGEEDLALRLAQHVDDILHTEAPEGFVLDYAKQFAEEADYGQLARRMMETA